MTDDELYDFYVAKLMKALPNFEANGTGAKKAMLVALQAVYDAGFDQGLDAGYDQGATE